MAKILFFSPSPQSKTGYGTAVRYTSRLLQARGHTVDVCAYNGQPGQPVKIDGATIWPRGVSLFDLVPELIARVKPDVTIVVCDPWIVSTKDWQSIAPHTRLVFWYPVHAYPMHPEFIDCNKAADTLLCYSEFGTRITQEAGLECHHVPLGIDPAIYRPLDRAECRAWFIDAMHAEDTGQTIVGMVAANSQTLPRDRKGFGVAFSAFAEFLKTEPDAILYVHTRADLSTNGEDLRYMAKLAGIADSTQFLSPFDWAAGVNDNEMARIYNAFTVLLAPSRTEGFGLPHLEAQACGTPVIATAFSSMPEIVTNGVCVEPAQVEIVDSIAGGYIATPDWRAIAEALITRPGSIPGPYQAIHEQYSWQTVTDRLCEVLEI